MNDLNKVIRRITTTNNSQGEADSLARSINQQNENQAILSADARCWLRLSELFWHINSSYPEHLLGVLDSDIVRGNDPENWPRYTYTLPFSRVKYMNTVAQNGIEKGLEEVVQELSNPITSSTIRFKTNGLYSFGVQDFLFNGTQVKLVSLRLVWELILRDAPHWVIVPGLTIADGLYHLDPEKPTTSGVLRMSVYECMRKAAPVEFRVTMSSKGVLINGMTPTEHSQRSTTLTIGFLGISIEEIMSSLRMEKSSDFVNNTIGHDSLIVNNVLSRTRFDIINTPTPFEKPSEEELMSSVTYNYLNDVDDSNFKHVLLCLVYMAVKANIAESVIFSPSVEELIQNQDWMVADTLQGASTHYIMLAWDQLPTFAPDYIHIIGLNLSGGEYSTIDKSEIGHQFTVGEKIFISPYNSNECFEYTSPGRLAFTGSRYINHRNLTYGRLVDQNYKSGSLITFTRERHSIVTKEPQVEWAELQVPYINPSLLTTAGLPQITTKRVLLNKQLLNDMLARNLYGAMSYESLVEYGLSLSYIKYYKGSIPVNVKDIDTEMIRIHAYVAYVLQQRNELATKLTIEALTGSAGLRLSLATVSAMLKFALQQITVSNDDNWFTDKLSKLLRGIRVDNKVGKLSTHWADLDCFARTSENFGIIASGVSNCDHHYEGNLCDSDITGIICSCCKNLTGQPDYVDLCIHCKPSTTPRQVPEKPDMDHFVLADNLTEEHEEESMDWEVQEEQECHDQAVIEPQYDLGRTAEVPRHQDPATTDAEELNSEQREGSHGSASTSGELDSVTSGSVTEDQTTMETLKIAVDPLVLRSWLNGEELEDQVDKTNYYSIIPAIPMGESTATVSDGLKIIKTLQVPEEHCGTEVIKLFTGVGLDPEWCNLNLGCREPLTGSQILKALIHFKVNVGVIVNNTITFTKVVNSDEFAVVNYISREGILGHWEAVQVQRTKVAIPYIIPGLGLDDYDSLALQVHTCKFSQLSKEKQLQVLKLLSIKPNHSTYSKHVDLKRVGNKLTNGLTSGTPFLDVNIEIEAEYHSLVDDLMKKSDIVEPIMTKVTDPWDFKSNLIQALKISYRNLAAVYNFEWKPKRVISGTLTNNSSLATIFVTSNKIKTGDVVVVKGQKFFYKGPIIAARNRLVIPQNVSIRQSIQVAVQVSKISSTSEVKRIQACKRVLANPSLMEKAKVLLRNATGIRGIWGCGKSNSIANAIQESELVEQAVAVTRGAQAGLVARLGNKLVASIESYSYMPDASVEVLHIDEASLLQPWQISLLTTANLTRINLYGDKHQIAAGYYEHEFGVVVKSNALELAANLQTADFTYRTGNPLMRELNKALGTSYVTKAEHTTDFEIQQMNLRDEVKLKQWIEESDVIICFYNDHVQYINNLIRADAMLMSRLLAKRNILPVVVTVESCQGLEAESILVYQEPFGRGNVHINKTFTLAAATRGRKQLRWVSVGMGSSSKWDLRQCLGYDLLGQAPDRDSATILIGPNGAELDPREVSVAEGVDLEDLSTEEINELVSKLVFKYMGEEELINTCQFDDIHPAILETIIRENAKKFNARVKVTLSEESIRVDIRVYLVSKYFIINRDMQVSTDLSEDHKVQLQRTINNVFGDKVVKRLASKIDKPPIRVWSVLSSEISRNLVMISHLAKIHEFMATTFTLKYQSAELLVQTTGGCSVCCGLKITSVSTGSTLHITEDYNITGVRYYSIEGEDHILESFITPDGFNTIRILGKPINETTEWSNLLTAERIHKFLKSGIRKLINGGQLMHSEENSSKKKLLEVELANRATFVGKFDGYSHVENWPIALKGPDDRIFYKVGDTVIKSTTARSWFTSTGMDLSEADKRKMVELAMRSDLDDFQKYAGYAVVENARRRLLGADPLSAMIKPLSWHENQPSSKVADKLRDKVTKLYFQKKRLSNRVFYTPTPVHNLISDLYKLPNITAAITGATQCDANLAAAEIVVLDAVASSRNDVRFIGETLFSAYSANLNLKFSLPWWHSQLNAQHSASLRTTRAMILNHIRAIKRGETVENENEAQALIEELELFSAKRACKFYYPSKEIKESTVVLGPSIFDLIETDVVNLILSSKELLFWAPYYQHDNYLHLSRSKIVIRPPKWFKVEGGHTILDGNKATILIKKTFSDVALYKLVTGHVTYASVQTARHNKVQVPMPVFLLSPEEIIDNKSFIKHEKVTVDIDIISSLMKRMLRPGTTFEDLLVHARTLYHSDRYSSVTIHRSVLETAAEAKNAAIVAYLLHKTELKSLDLFTGQRDQSIIRQTFMDGLKSLLGELGTIVESNAHSVKVDLDRVVEEVTGNKMLAQLVDNFVEELDKLQLMTLRPKRRINHQVQNLTDLMINFVKWLRNPNLHKSHDTLQSQEVRGRKSTNRKAVVCFFGTRGDQAIAATVATAVDYEEVVLFTNEDIVEKASAQLHGTSVRVASNGLNTNDIFAMWRTSNPSHLESFAIQKVLEEAVDSDLFVNNFNTPILEAKLPRNPIVIEYTPMDVMHELGKPAIWAFRQICKVILHSKEIEPHPESEKVVKKLRVQYSSFGKWASAININPVSNGSILNNKFVVYHPLLEEHLIEELITSLGRTNVVVVRGCKYRESDVDSVDLINSKDCVVLHHGGLGTCAAIAASTNYSLCWPVMKEQIQNANYLEVLGVSSTVNTIHDAISEFRSWRYMGKTRLRLYSLVNSELALDKVMKSLKTADYLVQPEAYEDRISYWVEELSNRKGFCKVVEHKVTLSDVNEDLTIFGMDHKLNWAVGEASGDLYAVANEPKYNHQIVGLNMWLINYPSDKTPAIFRLQRQEKAVFVPTQKQIRYVVEGTYICISCNNPLSSDPMAQCKLCTRNDLQTAISLSGEEAMVCNQYSLIDYLCTCGTHTCTSANDKWYCTCGKLITDGNVYRAGVTNGDATMMFKYVSNTRLNISECDWRQTIRDLSKVKTLQSMVVIDGRKPTVNFSPFIPPPNTSEAFIKKFKELMVRVQTYNRDQPAPAEISQLKINSSHEFMQRLSTGRSWTSSELHFVDPKYLKSTKISDSQALFLARVAYELEQNISPGATVGVYALEPGSIERSLNQQDDYRVVFASRKIEHLDSENTIWIETNHSLGRINACVRLLPWLLGPEASYIICGGRYGVHGIALEEVMRNSEYKDCSGTPSRRGWFYMDAAKLTTKPTMGDRLKIISILLNYGSIYGVDEAVAFMFPKMHLYHSDRWDYSNTNSPYFKDSRLDRWATSCTTSRLPDTLIKGVEIPLQWIEEGFGDITGFNKFIKLLDENFIPRKENSPSNRLEPLMIEKFHIMKANRNVKATRCELTTQRTISICGVGNEELFNPAEDTFCHREVLYYCVNEQPDGSTVEKFLKLDFQPLESVESLVVKATWLNFGVIIKNKDKHTVEIFNPTSPTLVRLEVSEGTLKTAGHVKLMKADPESNLELVCENDRKSIDAILSESYPRTIVGKLYDQILKLEALERQSPITPEYIGPIANLPEGLWKVVNNQTRVLIYKKGSKLTSNSDLYGSVQVTKLVTELHTADGADHDIMVGIEVEDSKSTISNPNLNRISCDVQQDEAKSEGPQDTRRVTRGSSTPNTESTSDQNEVDTKLQTVLEKLNYDLDASYEPSDTTHRRDSETSMVTAASQENKVFAIGDNIVGSVEQNWYKTVSERSLSPEVLVREARQKPGVGKGKELWGKLKTGLLAVELAAYWCSIKFNRKEANLVTVEEQKRLSSDSGDDWEDYRRQIETPALFYEEVIEDTFLLKYRMQDHHFNKLRTLLNVRANHEIEVPEEEADIVARANTIINFYWDRKDEIYLPRELSSIPDVEGLVLSRKDLLTLSRIEGWNIEHLPNQDSYMFKPIKFRKGIRSNEFRSIVYLSVLRFEPVGFGALPEEPEEEMAYGAPESWENAKIGTDRGPDYHFFVEPPKGSWLQSEFKPSRYQLTCMDSLGLLGGKVQRLYKCQVDRSVVPLAVSQGPQSLILETSTQGSEWYDKPLQLVPQPKTVYIYEDEHGMLDVIVPLPNVDIGLRVRQQPVEIKEFTKYKLTNYPEQAVPAYTKRMLSSTIAVSKLFGSQAVHRKHWPRHETEGERLVKYCYGPGARDKILTNRRNELWYNLEDMLQWLKQRPDRNKITTELITVIEEGMLVHPLNILNIHNKIEARLKDVLLDEESLAISDTNDIPKTKIRQIVWQKKGLTAIFAPVFTRAKQRFKDLLAGGKVLYVDGYTPWQINKRLHQIKVVQDTWFYEDDLEAQDKQTDKHSLDFEMWWYVNHLGVSPVLVDLWREAHNHWIGKNQEVQILEDGMRQTGQATTALGNALTNLVSKSRTVERYFNTIDLMMILGDDNLIILREEPDLSKSVEDAAIYYNMVNKPVKSKTGGGFLRMQAHISKEGYVALGPDIVRLRRRFELTNNNSASDVKNLENRAENYKYMVGDLFGKFGSKYPLWYDYQELRKSLAAKYNTTEAEIDNNAGLLVDMILENKAQPFTKTMFANIEHRTFKT
ncbi:polyprotein [Rhizopus microsporus endornavirus 1]|nr:polyprotein [Rhizopus microsporus endornavirus 1]